MRILCRKYDEKTSMNLHENEQAKIRAKEQQNGVALFFESHGSNG